MKSQKVKIKTDFHDKVIPKEGFYYICLPMTLINLVLENDKNYYSQVFFEECDCIVKEII